MKIAHIYPAVSEVYRTAVEKKHGTSWRWPVVSRRRGNTVVNV